MISVYTKEVDFVSKYFFPHHSYLNPAKLFILLFIKTKSNNDMLSNAVFPYT